MRSQERNETGVISKTGHSLGCAAGGRLEPEMFIKFWIKNKRIKTRPYYVTDIRDHLVPSFELMPASSRAHKQSLVQLG